ncbi:hypothetical protein KEJ49_01380 [Candidatus Bathyarchaeota archaeon]|nr:hypothetical protein [Candidatus Bathyarchaeota archaeon]
MKEVWTLIEWLMEISFPISIFLISLISLSRMREMVILRRGYLGMSPSKGVEFIGLTLGILGIIMTLVGIFMPIYMVEADIQTPFSLDQRGTELIVLDGWNGVQINNSLIGKLPLIISLQSFMRMLFLASIWFTALDIVGMKRGKDIGNNQMIGGAFLLVFLIIIPLSIYRLNWIIELLPADVRGALTPTAIESIKRIALQPLQGTQTITISGLNVDISWGIGPGYYGILVAAMMKIAGGIILRRTSP